MENRTQTLALWMLVIFPVVFQSLSASTQTFKTLYNFPGGTNASNPSRLTLSGNTLYGLAGGNGTSSSGMVFSIKTDGTGFSNLHSFTNGVFTYFTTNSSLALSGNTLFGETAFGRAFGKGEVFSLNTDGSGFATLHDFTMLTGPGYPDAQTNIDGANPTGGLFLSGSNLYGTTLYGGEWGWGTLFSLRTNDGTLATLYSFPNGPAGGFTIPGISLISNCVLYGTVSANNVSYTDGFVFSINTDGTGYDSVFNFQPGFPYGYEPNAVALSASTLFGSTQQGGLVGTGALFTVNTNGSNIVTLSNTPIYLTDAPIYDGGTPNGPLLLSGSLLFGSLIYYNSTGVVFAWRTNGSGFTFLHSFTNLPTLSLISGNTLYGTTSGRSGSFTNGSIFSLTLPAPQLTISPLVSNVVLSWPTNVGGFDTSGYFLLSTTNLAAPVAWNTVFPPPNLVNGTNTVTNDISSFAMFYRLSQ